MTSSLYSASQIPHFSRLFLNLSFPILITERQRYSRKRTTRTNSMIYGRRVQNSTITKGLSSNVKRERQTKHQQADAVFIGWQRTKAGASIPLFNIVALGHPSSGSTVTSTTLIHLHLRVPQIPLSPEQGDNNPRHKSS